MSTAELEKLSSKEVQEYILTHEKDDVLKLLLHKREIFGLPFASVADQIIARKKIFSKAPSFYKESGIVYPSALNLEQSSSETTAKFKVEFLLKEFNRKNFGKVADITGGFGIDSYVLSQASTNLDFVEPNATLTAIVKHNFDILGIQNVVYHCSKVEDFLNASSRKVDLVLVDPSRRDIRSKKVFRLSDCQPDIKSLLPKLFNITNRVLLKVSPLLDLQLGLNELEHVKKIIVVSVANECKELLFLLQDNFSGEPSIETYSLDKQGRVVHSFCFTIGAEKTAHSDFGDPQLYLYEPNASILKSGAFKLIGEKFSLRKLHPNTHLYTSSVVLKKFPGRVFKIEELAFNRSNIPERKANVITRNYPLTAEQLKKILKLEDGGENYVIGFSGMKKKFIVRATRLE